LALKAAGAALLVVVAGGATAIAGTPPAPNTYQLHGTDLHVTYSTTHGQLDTFTSHALAGTANAVLF
jgi:hypothetical protein